MHFKDRKTACGNNSEVPALSPLLNFLLHVEKNPISCCHSQLLILVASSISTKHKDVLTLWELHFISFDSDAIVPLGKA